MKKRNQRAMPGDPVGSMKTTHPHTSHRSSTYTSLRMRLSIVTTLLGTAAAGTTALWCCAALCGLTTTSRSTALRSSATLGRAASCSTTALWCSFSSCCFSTTSHIFHLPFFGCGGSTTFSLRVDNYQFLESHFRHLWLAD